MKIQTDKIVFEWNDFNGDSRKHLENFFMSIQEDVLKGMQEIQNNNLLPAILILPEVSFYGLKVRLSDDIQISEKEKTLNGEQID